MEKENYFEKLSRIVKNSISDFFYGIKVKLHKRFGRKKKGSVKQKKIKDIAFYSCVMLLPMIILVVNVIFINGNSILLAFKNFNFDTKKYQFAGFVNFGNVLKDFALDDVMKSSLLRSLLVYAISVVVTAAVPIAFSFYIYKKLPLYNFLKVVLFLPSIISGIVTVTEFKFLVDMVIPDVMIKYFHIDMKGLLSSQSTVFPTVFGYYLWMTFGGGLLINLGAMSSVDKSVTEASKLDGVNLWQEFWHVVFPKSYQVISIGFILGFTTIFTNDIGLYAFYGTSATTNLYTLGYYFTVRTLDANPVFDYPYLAAWGLIVTAICVPITFLIRYLVYHYGPQED